MLDIEMVKVWQRSHEDANAEFEANLTHLDDERLFFKLIEILRECIDLPLDFDELSKGLISTIKDYINPSSRFHNIKFAQASIDAQLEKFRMNAR